MDRLLLAILNMSLTASYVILIIFVVRLFLKKAPKSVSYALWGVAGFRLVSPFSFESVFSLLPFNAAPIPQDIAWQTSPRIESGTGAAGNSFSVLFNVPAVGASANPLQVLFWIGSYIWLAGVVVMLVYSVVSISVLRKRLQNARLTEENIYEADNLKTPFVLGFFKPRIYMPAGLAAEEKTCVILHERMHIRRFDHVVKQAAYFILCVHWFNPLAWLGFLLMSADMELSCDERVLRDMGGNIKKVYSSSLLSFATNRRILNGSPLAFGEGGVTARVKNVLSFKKPTRLAIIISVAVVAVLSLGFATNRADGPQNAFDFYDFQMNGIRLGEAVYVDETATGLTPAALLNVDDGYQYNFAEARFSIDRGTERLNRLRVPAYENGVHIPDVIVNGGLCHIQYDLKTIEQVESFFGDGQSGWYNREQGLKYMKYQDKRGFRSATVTFIYENDVSDMEHRLAWVEAETNLSYPIENRELRFRLFVWKEDGKPQYSLISGAMKPHLEEIYRTPPIFTSLDALNVALSANISLSSKQTASLDMVIFPMNDSDFTEEEILNIMRQIKQPGNLHIEVGRRVRTTAYDDKNRITYV